MALVEDHEREAAATTTNIARTVAQAVTPALTGWVMQAVALAAPFVAGGAPKNVYHLLLYWSLRDGKMKVYPGGAPPGVTPAGAEQHQRWKTGWAARGHATPP